MPSIILMDGGKGQVNIAKEVLNEFNLDIPVLGLVKDDKHRTRGIIYENDEIRLKVNTPLYRLLFAIQERDTQICNQLSQKTSRKKLQEI